MVEVEVVRLVGVVMAVVVVVVVGRLVSPKRSAVARCPCGTLA